jgi:hypothetical protein
MSAGAEGWSVRTRRVAGRVANQGLTRFGYELVRTPTPSTPALPLDFDEHTAATVEAVRSYTMTSPERIFMLCEAVRYLVRADVQGAFVECGVWRGGSSLAIVRTLVEMGVADRDVYLLDTFESMPPPGPEDVDVFGVAAADQHAQAAGLPEDPTYAYLPMALVRALFERTGYPMDRIHFVPGLVEDTIPDQAPDRIALLRLDTDYYESTRHELRHLYPRITPGGVLLIDDYGHFLGCRQATDEYLAELAAQGAHLLLNRIDYTGRLAIVEQPPGHRAGGLRG